MRVEVLYRQVAQALARGEDLASRAAGNMRRAAVAQGDLLRRGKHLIRAVASLDDWLGRTRRGVCAIGR